MAKILLVDNNKDFLLSRRDFLEKSGYPTESASSLPEAREKLKEKNQYGLAVVDVRLTDDSDASDFSGLALVREMDPAMPVILYSGYVRNEDIQDFNAEGRVIDFLFTKDDPDPMLQAIRNALARQRSKKTATHRESSKTSLYNSVGVFLLISAGILTIFGLISGNLLAIILTFVLIIGGAITLMVGAASE